MLAILAAQAVAFSVLSSIVASNKNLDIVPWAMFGFFFGIFGFIAALVVSEGEPSTDGFDPEQHNKKCPDCAEYIKLEARVCKHCGREFSDEQVEHHVQQARESATADKQTDPEPSESPLSTGQQWAVALAFFVFVIGLGLVVTLVSGG